MEQKFSFSALDRHFARFLTSLSGQNTPELYYATALLSHHVAEGHVCLDLKTWERRRIIDCDEYRDVFTAPKLKDWRMKLLDCQAVGVPGEFKPLILDKQSRLYLYRYWEYENILADRIKRLAFHRPGTIIRRPDLRCVERLFPGTFEHEPDWQKIAALMLCFKTFLVISGSPGTGKTTTVAGMLALLLEQAPETKQRIALAAPTGKAAARLQDAIRSAKQALACDPTIKARIPENASTVHRLLGSLHGSPYFRHHQKNLLPLDIVVVDEASMLDLPLLSKLVQAMPENGRLILLGDKNQLASVEAGAVLGDLCGGSPANLFSREILKEIMPYTGGRFAEYVEVTETPGVHDCIIELRKNYRFTDRSGIGKAGAAVNRGEGIQLLQLLTSHSGEHVFWSSLPKPGHLERILKPFVLNGFRNYLNLIHAGAAWDDIFTAFDHFRILCALRRGPFGVAAINQHIENILEAEHLITFGRPCYCGQPVMITGNNPQLRIYNGDIGLILADPDKNGELSAVFPDGAGQYRRFSPQRLPEYETVYAMTVHKSQGSEFDAVLLVLSDHDAPILTRELVYTGITRARKQVRIWSTEDVFVSAISRCIQRTSGLRDALW
ncbi:MAG: exodeoxyribonuclease V subunit alpha [Pseudomonadota bacterium]